ncbi:hypothetical protein ACRRTK_002638 [Alexandromys fortis]
MGELANKRLELMGQAVFKRIQFPCKASRVGAGQREAARRSKQQWALRITAITLYLCYFHSSSHLLHLIKN